jgi:hypothetical protein
MKQNNKAFHINSSSGLKKSADDSNSLDFSRNFYDYLPFYPLLSLLETILLRMIVVARSGRRLLVVVP